MNAFGKLIMKELVYIVIGRYYQLDASNYFVLRMPHPDKNKEWAEKIGCNLGPDDDDVARQLTFYDLGWNGPAYMIYHRPSGKSVHIHPCHDYTALLASALDLIDQGVEMGDRIPEEIGEKTRYFPDEAPFCN